MRGQFAGVEGGDDPGGALWIQFKLKRTGREQIFAKIQTALQFSQILVVQKPDPVSFERSIVS